MNKFAENDFEITNLPKTRRAQFFDIIKHNFSTIIAMGLFLLIISIPLICSILFEDFFTYSLFNNTAYYVEGNLNEEGMAIYNSNILFSSLLKNLSFVLIFTFGSGVFRVARQLYWGEHVTFLKEVKKGIKSGWLNSLLFGLLFAFLRFGITLAEISIDNIIINVIDKALFLVFVLPIIIIGMVYSQFYNGNIFKVIHHSFIVYIKKVPYIILILLGFIIAPLIQLINLFIIKTGIIIILIFIGLPIFILFWNGLVIHSLDKVINSTYYPDIENKGLFIDQND